MTHFVPRKGRGSDRDHGSDQALQRRTGHKCPHRGTSVSRRTPLARGIRRDTGPSCERMTLRCQERHQAACPWIGDFTFLRVLAKTPNQDQRKR